MDNVIDYREEAQLCLDETAYALQDGGISYSLPSDSPCAFLNLTTREGLTFCVCLSSNGFRVVGRDYDRNDIAEDEAEVYESIYSLLTAISPSYQHTFSEAVTSKLNQLVDTDH